MTRIYPKMKQVMFKGFFDRYVYNRFYSDDNNGLPLYELFVSEKNSVVSRYDKKIKQLCQQEGIGYDSSTWLHMPQSTRNFKLPKFFT